MNILILSCGTRYKLVEAFKNRDSGFDRVIVTDCSKYAPALYIADKYYIVPEIRKAGYLDVLLDICRKEKIDMVLPLHEDELLFVAEKSEEFRAVGVIPVVSEYEKVCLCKDKYRLNCYLREHGIAAVATESGDGYKIPEPFVPVFVKPRYGAGSVHVAPVYSKSLLCALLEDREEEKVIQPLLNGKEFGVDVYVDFISKKIVALFCKEKLRMRAGETEKSISVINKEIETLVSRAITELNLVGPLDVDVMEHEGTYYILEINPRFGGGYLHAYECGIRFPDYLACNGRGLENELENAGYEEGVVALQYTDLYSSVLKE